jgi:hypothetical protein
MALRADLLLRDGGRQFSGLREKPHVALKDQPGTTIVPIRPDGSDDLLPERLLRWRQAFRRRRAAPRSPRETFTPSKSGANELSYTLTALGVDGTALWRASIPRIR